MAILTSKLRLRNAVTSTASPLQLVCAFVLIVITVFTTTLPAATADHTPLQIDALRAEYINLEQELWKYLDKIKPSNEEKSKKVYDLHRDFINGNINRTFESSNFDIIDHNGWRLVKRDLLQIDGIFKFYKTFMNEQKSGLNERAILDITETLLRKDKMFSMSRNFQNIELIMVNRTLYYSAMMESTKEACNIQQSAQQFLYTLYTDTALTELKGYIMMEFSWMMSLVYGNGNFSQEEAAVMRRDYETRAKRSQNLLRELMIRADRIILRCDPTHYVLGKTYDKVTRLLQGYVENEVDMSIDETCREDCSYYDDTKSERCFKSRFCARQAKCSGRLYDCTFVNSDSFVCLANRKSMRRYEYISYDNGRVLGKQTPCVRGATRVESWHRYLFWRCSYCFCLCDEVSIKSDRYFNLRETLSDTKHNKVITGLRFVKHNRVFHIQIQEGELMPRGNINSSSLSWKPVDDYKIFDREVRSGRDYHTLSYESRSIDLDDIHTEDNTFLLTGVRFKMVGTHLLLEAHFSEFNFRKGKLTPPEVNGLWKSNDNTAVTGITGAKRTKLSLAHPDIPTRTIVNSLPDSQHNQYIDFTNTDMDKDAAQSTVPFIDIQDVVSNPPVPLSGIGIYHKGRPDFGGFIAPKIMTYDFTPHVQVPKTDST